MSNQVYVVIMAGGVGSRFWPYSRNSRPKQFIDILGTGKSLLQMTYERFLQTSNKDNILVVTNQMYAGLVKEQLPEILDDHILCEPDRKNTAPCIAYAAYKIKSKDPNAIMVVTPADHAVFQTERFAAVIGTAVDAANNTDKLVTVGITPTRPETGYGYIQYLPSKDKVLKVKTFTEKPQIEKAKEFLASGDYAWNAGIFIWSINTITNAFGEHLPAIARAFEKANDMYYTEAEAGYINPTYSQIEGISIDYGILEKSSNVYVVPGDFDWSDLGSWSSLHEMRDKDDKKNVVDGKVIIMDAENNIIKSETDRLLVLDDLEGYLIGDFEDVLIVCKKDNEAKFREYVAAAKSKTGDTHQ